MVKAHHLARNGFRLLQTKSLVKFMGHTGALLLSGSDIRFLGTTGLEPEPEPDSKKQRDIQPSRTGTGYPVHP